MICSRCNIDKPAGEYYSHANCCKQCYKHSYRSLESKLRHVYSDQKRQGVTYSLNTWIQCQLDNPTYVRLFNEWEASGFKRALTPTFYRKDASQAFSFDNLELEQWKHAVHHLNRRA